jgi:cell division protein FtsI/penicillin-binding protein 2
MDRLRHTRPFTLFRLASFALILIMLTAPLFAASSTKRRPTKSSTTRTAAAKRATVKRAPARSAVRKASYKRSRPVVRGGPWDEPTYADSTKGDNVDGEDLEVRRAAVESLGPYNGSVVVVDPNTGRILTMVNQKLALGSGFQPCSTVKVPVALAALNEKVIAPDTRVRVYGRTSMTLTEALARSNNPFFANLGNKLGYDKVSYYARLFGYGEKAGLDIPGEKPGRFPSAPPKNGGMGMLCSFGEEISQTPLQLAALMSALANGGTLYYLQYPRNEQELNQFVPRVKRQLDIGGLIPAVKPGMLGAVQFGTARRAQQEDPIAGKTGTCTESRTHLGWFGSFMNVGQKQLVVVVLLTGGRPAIGPTAAGIAGDIYRRLTQDRYFARREQTVSPASLISTQICCTQ